MNPKNLLDFFQNKQDEITDLIREIVEIESPTYDIDGSKKVVDWIGNEIKQILPDAKIERIFKENYGEHLIIRAFEDVKNGKPILLLGHTDTVHPIGSKEQNPTRIEDGKLYGCGTFDMKANIVLILQVFKALKEFGLKPLRPINVLLACDEEVGSDTGRELVEREAKKAEFCLVFEPSLNGKVKTGRKGTGNYILKTHGIPSHAGLEPKKGASAILEIAKQIEKLHGFTNFEIGTTVSVGTIKGGTTSNVVPAEAECSIDVRFETLDEANRIENEFKSLKPFDERVKLELLGEINRPPMERTEGVVKLFEKAKTLAKTFDCELEETQVGGASDGNFVGALGVPLLDGLGIAGDNAHRLDEYVLVEDIPNRATLLTLFLLAD
ncbi:MAG: M20 family metallopeptidase [Aridibacter sp.]